MLNNTASLIIIVYYLRCSPLYRYLSSMGHIIVFIFQVPGHAKVCNLKGKYYYFFIIPFSITTSPYMSPDFPPGCSWQQGLCVQSSSWTGTPYLKQSDDSTPAPVEVVLMGPVPLDYSCKEISINTIIIIHWHYRPSECVHPHRPESVKVLTQISILHYLNHNHHLQHKNYKTVL